MTPEETLDAVLTEEQAQVEAPAVEQTQGQEAPVIPDAPQFDPSVFEAMAQSQYGLQEKLGGLEATLNSMRQQQEQANRPAPSEEEMIMAQLQEKMGIKQMQEMFTNQMQEKDNTIAEMKQMLDAINTERTISQRQSQVDALASKYQGFDEMLIVQELQNLNQYNPKMAQALNNSQGWEMLWTSKFGNVSARQPDAITPSETTGGEFGSETNNRFAKGEATSDDIANALFSYVG